MLDFGNTDTIPTEWKTEEDGFLKWFASGIFDRWAAVHDSSNELQYVMVRTSKKKEWGYMKFLPGNMTSPVRNRYTLAFCRKCIAEDWQDQPVYET